MNNRLSIHPSPRSPRRSSPIHLRKTRPPQNRRRKSWRRRALLRPTGRPRWTRPTSPEDSGIHIDGATITRALLGGGGFLAAGMLAVYVGRRRTQTRNRRSGRATPSVAPGLRADDKALRAIGADAGQRLAFFDSALRELAQLAEDSGLRLPDVAAARIDQERLELHLAHPELAAPDPWIASPDGSVWSVSLTHAPRTLGADLAVSGDGDSR